MPKISVIIPVFNVAHYLRRCLDSVLAQTFDDFELLVIDDGSTDGSSDICDEYALKDNRVKVFHKPNGGVSSARNLGLDNAKGEWIAFVDSDDWVCEDYLENMMPIGDEDFIMESAHPQGNRLHDGIYSGKEISNDIVDFCIHIGCPWGKMFKREIIISNDLRFDERISLGEDTLFVVEYCSLITYMRLSSQRKYNYTQNVAGSLTTKPIEYNIAVYTFIRSAIAFHKYAMACNNKQMEAGLARHCGISLTHMTFYLKKCSIKERARLIGEFFKTGEVNTAMYYVGRRFRPFTWCGTHGLYKLAAFLLPPL